VFNFSLKIHILFHLISIFIFIVTSALFDITKINIQKGKKKKIDDLIFFLNTHLIFVACI